jgi:hypothetical protein
MTIFLEALGGERGNERQGDSCARMVRWQPMQQLAVPVPPLELGLGYPMTQSVVHYFTLEFSGPIQWIFTLEFLFRVVGHWVDLEKSAS